MTASFHDRLRDARPILLDGPTGTELTRRGISLDTPLWSASALEDYPDVVMAIHADYVMAGAEIITANTFRTHARNLASAGRASQAGELTRKAVELARQAAGQQVWVAGSLAPLEDCYRPDLVPSISELEREHVAMAEQLATAGVDLILVETHNCVTEVRAASRAAMMVGLPFLASVVCGADGRLLSGESVASAAEAVLEFGPAGLLVNCLPVDAVIGALRELRQVAADVRFGAYANTGVSTANGWIETAATKPADYAAAAAQWLDEGARIIGGCCGTTPSHITALRGVIDGTNRPESLS